MYKIYNMTSKANHSGEKKSIENNNVIISFQTITEHNSFEWCLKNIQTKVENIKSIVFETEGDLLKFEVKDFKITEDFKTNEFIYKASHSIEITIPKNQFIIIQTIKKLQNIDHEAIVNINLTRQSNPKLYNELYRNRKTKIRKPILKITNVTI